MSAKLAVLHMRHQPPAVKPEAGPFVEETVEKPLIAKGTKMPSAFMPLFEELWSSTFWLNASDHVRVNALPIWAHAWKRIPACSLPNSEKYVSGLIGCEPTSRKWKGLRQAVMWNWVLCEEDGLLYHRFMAGKANEFLSEWATERDRKRAARGAERANGSITPRRSPRGAASEAAPAAAAGQQQGSGDAAAAQQGSSADAAGMQHGCSTTAALLHKPAQGNQGLSRDCPAPSGSNTKGIEDKGNPREQEGAKGEAPPPAAPRTAASSNALSTETDLPPRKTGITPTWQPDAAMIACAEDKGLDWLKVRTAFVGHYANTGRKNPYWGAAWEKWCQEDADAGRNIAAGRGLAQRGRHGPPPARHSTPAKGRGVASELADILDQEAAPHGY